MGKLVEEQVHLVRVQAIQDRAAAEELIEKLRDEASVVCNRSQVVPNVESFQITLHATRRNPEP